MSTQAPNTIRRELFNLSLIEAGERFFSPELPTSFRVRLEQIVKAGLPIPYYTENPNMNLFMFLVRDTRVAELQLIMDHDASIDWNRDLCPRLYDNYPKSPLWIAVRDRNAPVVKFLLQSGKVDTTVIDLPLLPVGTCMVHQFLQDPDMVQLFWKLGSHFPPTGVYRNVCNRIRVRHQKIILAVWKLRKKLPIELVKVIVEPLQRRGV